MRSVPRRFAGLLLALGALGCASRTASETAPASVPASLTAPPAAAGMATALVVAANLVPDVGPNIPGLLDRLPDGSRRAFVYGIRIVDHADGSIERAKETLPGGMPTVVELPARLGGGMLLISQAAETTRLYRTDDWLGRATPLARLSPRMGEILAGFDRLYARQASGDWAALDPRTGDLRALGPLPLATRIDAMAFADAWRGVVVADLLGPLATFDAGASWHRIPVPSAGPTRIRAFEGSFVLETPGGRMRLGVHGELVRDTAAPLEVAPSSEQRDASPFSTTRLLGSRPLRAVIEDGWPATPSGASFGIFARAGAVYRVRLSDGGIVDRHEHAFAEALSTCHAIALLDSFGFVCGGAGAGTAVYAFEAPLDVREVMRFDNPRSVVSSGNGGIVVRGSCARDAPPPADLSLSPVASAPSASASGTLLAQPSMRLVVFRGQPSAFCFVSPLGTVREVVLWREWAGPDAPPARALSLRDGTAVIVVPKAAREKGKALFFVPGSAQPRSVPLQVQAGAPALEKAQWLDGLYELPSGAIAGWVQLGDELLGVRLSRAGEVTFAPARLKVETAIVAGRLAVDWRRGANQALETIDGGTTTRAIDLPLFDALPNRREVAACSPIGCATGSWMRVGWGADPALDAALPELAEPRKIDPLPRIPMLLRCEWTAKAKGPREGPASPPRTPPRPDKALAVRPPGYPSASQPPSDASARGAGWRAFRGSSPPVIASDDALVEAQTMAYETSLRAAQVHVYAWGPKGADWSRVGRWLAKFDDPFDLSGVRTTASSLPLWSDETALADVLGSGPSASGGLRAIRDVSGTAAIVYAHTAARRTGIFGLAQGEPIVVFRGADESALPDPTSVVRTGPIWYFLAGRAGAPVGVSLYKVEGGSARTIARLPRVQGAEEATLVRRVVGNELGILVLGTPSPDRSARDLYVIPVDVITGELEQPVKLVANDFGGRLPRRCRGDEDGWWIDAAPAVYPAFDMPGRLRSTLGPVELKLRIDPGDVCVEAIAAPRSDRIPAGAPVSVADAGAVPMLVTDGERRFEAACRP